MWKKLLPALVFGGFILLVSLASYLFISLRNKEITTKVPTESTEIGVISQGQDDPIKKTNSPDGDRIIYEIEGSLAGEFVRQGILLKAEFIIRGDLLERKIPLYLGAVDGTSSFGSYEGSFRSDSTWVKTALGVISQEIEPGEPLIIKVEYPVTGSQSDLKTRKHEEILDGLIVEFTKEEYAYQIPSDFELTATRIGVLR